MRFLISIIILIFQSCCFLENSTEPKTIQRVIILPNPIVSIELPENFIVISEKNYEELGWNFNMRKDDGTIDIYFAWYTVYNYLPDTLIHIMELSDTTYQRVYRNRIDFSFFQNPFMKSNGALFYENTNYTLRNRKGVILLKSRKNKQYELYLQVDYRDDVQRELLNLLSTINYY